MLDDRISKLSDIQKQCLRLSATGLVSKEIAMIVGKSHHTIDQYLSRASGVLGAASRREAARIFSEIDDQTEYKRLVYKSPELAEPTVSGSSEEQTEQTSLPRDRLGLPPVGGRSNDLISAQRLIAVGKIALFLMIIVLTMIMLAKGAFLALS